MGVQSSGQADGIKCTGSCHCGKVEIHALVPYKVIVQRCNCSICTKSGYLHLIVNNRDFSIVRGENELQEYRFNSRTARHLFCRTCGIKSFYVPRSHPDGYSVNLNCLILPPEIEVTVEDFNGRLWEKNISKLHEY